ncbi:MAG: IS1634 family transposase [Candidatus Dormibacteria bacterium]
MYLRTIQRRNRDGTVVRYVQLAHNHWDPKSQVAKAEVLYNFGREDELDRDAVRRLIRSLQRALPPEETLQLQAPELRFLESRPMGGAFLLDGLWHRLGIDGILNRLGSGRKAAHNFERVCFAMVANRALAPASKLAAATWVNEQTVIPGLVEVDEDQCYRAMDSLLAMESEVAEAVYWALADLIHLEVDLIFFDTTSTYFDVDQADPDTAEGLGFRRYGHSKDHRPDRPQVVIGMAVTKGGIPIRVWCWPGSQADMSVVPQVKAELGAWKLNRVVWVLDRGFNSEENRTELLGHGGNYIVSEKLRSRSADVQAVLSCPGRYRWVAPNLAVKDVELRHGSKVERFVLCRNSEEAARDGAVRQRLVEQLEKVIRGSDRWSQKRRWQLLGELRTKPGLNRFVGATEDGYLRVDRRAVAAEAHLDGKFVLRTSDQRLTAAEVALGYKQLLEVERGWRDLKHHLDLRPVYHHKEDRIRAHVVLCWLSLLLIRLAENESHDSWRNLRRELEKMHLGRFTGPHGEVLQRTESTPCQEAIFRTMQVAEPPTFIRLEAVPQSLSA